MTKELKGELYFSDHEPRIIGHLQIGEAHYEIIGIRRSAVRADLTGYKTVEKQEDFFDEHASGAGEG
jgi:hypothetical protein